MILEAVRINADWFGHATYGVNALLAAVPRDAGDPVPPNVVRVLDTTRNPEVEQDDFGADWPVLVVRPGGLAQAEGEVGAVHRHFEAVPVEVLYVGGEEDSAQSSTNVLYTLRAIARSVRELMRQVNEPFRTRNDIVLLSARSLAYGEVDPEEGQGILKGGVRIVYQAKDKAP